MAMEQVVLPSSLSRRVSPAMAPLGLSVVAVVLAVTGDANRINDWFPAVAWAAFAAMILVPAWRERRLPALIVTEDGLSGPREESILRWGDVAGIWVGHRYPRWFLPALRPMTLLGWDLASLEFTRRADARALPRYVRLVATGASGEEVVTSIRRFTSLPVGDGHQVSRRRFLRNLMDRLP